MVLAQDLRNAVLQAAFRGNLTKQLTSDTDVQITINIIKSEKKALIKKKNARDDDNLPEINENEKAFLIPENWSWARIGDVGIYKKGPFGSALTKSMFIPKSGDSVKVYEQKNAIQKNYSLGNYYVKKDYYEDKMKSFTVESGDIIVSCAGTIGETYIMPDNIELGIINQALMRMNIVDSVNIEYFLKYFDHILKEEARKKSKGSAIKNIPPFNIFKKMLIPLPPIEEQQRIVDRISELMEKIDEYEEVEKELLALEQKFPDDMKNALLLAAMQGKLTEQLDSDSSVDEMLDVIKEEKKQLIKDKKIKKEKQLPPIEEDEVPFDIPENWRWERFSNIVILNPRNSLDDALEVSFIPMTLISDGYNNEHTAEKRIWKDVKKGFTHIKEGDLGFAKITPCFQNRKSVIFKNLVNGYAAGTTELHIIRTIPNSLLAEYLLWFVKSPYFVDGGVNTYTGTAGQQRIHKDYLPNCLVPVPPIEEQQRIVERLEQLFPLCETL